MRAEVVQQETAPAIEPCARGRSTSWSGSDDPVPVPRHRDVDRRDLIREEVLLAVPLGSPRTTLADVEHEPWAAGQPGSGQAAAVENVCNRLGGYAPDIRHRSDDGLILRALVSSGQAVTLLPALIAAATPGVSTHRIPGLYRTIFTAARAAAAQAPAVVAVREAIEDRRPRRRFRPRRHPPRLGWGAGGPQHWYSR